MSRPDHEVGEIVRLRGSLHSRFDLPESWGWGGLQEAGLGCLVLLNAVRLGSIQDA